MHVPELGFPASLSFYNLSLTLTFECDLDSVKVNQHAKYLGQRSFQAKVTVRTHRHSPTGITKEVGNNIL